MRLAVFDQYRIGVVREQAVVDVSHAVPGYTGRWPWSDVLTLVAELPRLRPTLEAAAREGPSRPLASVRLRAPVPLPGKLLAAPVNYRPRQLEMNVETDAASQGVYLKAPSAVVGASDAIVLPFADRRVDYEGELAVVIGRVARHVPAERALEYVAGYTGGFDITLRGRESAATRKSFDTFAPLGPVLLTADEVPDPGELTVKVYVNDELRQRATAREMLLEVPELIAWASRLMTLYPGDVIMTGTPPGVGPLRPGDRLALEIPRIGRLELPVRGPEAAA
ncbi:MAG: fumarylacetoacetate hydrolase family protein [Chloroflexi bacterium]|nr:fumarylacetoacetate hydrolase family protein [Chloroflexota bacterium]